MSDALWNRDKPAAPSNYPDQGLDVEIQQDDDEGQQIDPKTGALEIPTDDGGVIIDFNPQTDDDDDDDFDQNLAAKLSESQLGSIAETLLDAIKSDDDSRADWLQQRAKGLDLLGLKLEPPRGSAPSSSAPLDGMSTVRHPLLLEAVLRFQANARGELLPSSGPVKIRDDGDETTQSSELGESLEKDMNHYLTVDAPEYYPDTDRMFFWVGFGGSGFKKVYPCPLRRRPVSESVEAKDLIVSDAATDLRNAGRVTQRISMRPSVMKRMQVLGAYLDVSLTQPTPKENAVDQKEAAIQGYQTWHTRPEDQPYNLFECYCELDLPGYEDEDDGEATGLPLPYRVTIEEDSRKILAVHRNWEEDDEYHDPCRVFVEFPYVKGMGFYGIGLLHILGNSTMALTAAWRECLDMGMFANFPGFLISKIATRQNTNEIRVAPGTGFPIETGNTDISKAIMPLPYKDITPGLMALIDKVTSAAQRVGSTADMNVGEGNQEAPVGTTLAMIEQATRIESAVHKRLHQSQSEEFQLLRDLFAKDPEALWRCNPKSYSAAMLGVDMDDDDDPNRQAAIDKFKAALADANLVPVADPNTPSHVHRLLKAVALKQLQAASPTLYDPKEVDTRILHMIGWSDAESLFAKPQPQQAPQLDPLAQAQIALKSRELDIKQQQLGVDSAQSAQEASAKRETAIIDLAKEIAIHGENADSERLEQQANQQAALQQSASDAASQQASLAAAKESKGGRVITGDGAQQGNDGRWYIKDPTRPDKHLMLVDHHSGHFFMPVSHDPFLDPDDEQKKSAPKKD